MFKKVGKHQTFKSLKEIFRPQPLSLSLPFVISQWGTKPKGEFRDFCLQSLARPMGTHACPSWKSGWSPKIRRSGWDCVTVATAGHWSQVLRAQLFNEGPWTLWASLLSMTQMLLNTENWYVNSTDHRRAHACHPWEVLCGYWAFPCRERGELGHLGMLF